MNMPLSEAIDQATKFTDEEMVSFDHWRVVMAVLLEEVKKNEYAGLNRTISALSHDLADENKRAQEWKERAMSNDPCRCPACMESEEANTLEEEEPTAQLPSAFLADIADSIADDLAFFAGELNLYHVKYEQDAQACRGPIEWLTGIAKQLRDEN